MKRIFITFLFLLVSVSAHSKIYKCRDMNGQIRYSDKVCSATGSDNVLPPKKSVPKVPAGGDEVADIPKTPSVTPALMPPDPPAKPEAAPSAQHPEIKQGASVKMMDKVRGLFSSSKKESDIPTKENENMPQMGVPTANFICQGKTHCSEMTSCEEALYYLNHCPGSEMDGDGDGIPCERQWCNE